MSHLKKESLNKSYSLLKEFIESSEGMQREKGVARLALAQLHRIAAGTIPEGIPVIGIQTVCAGRPRGEATPTTQG